MYNPACFDIHVLQKQAGFYCKFMKSSHWMGYALHNKATEHVISYHKVHAAVRPYLEVACSVGPTRCSNFISAIFQQPFEVHKWQIVLSDSQGHNDGITVSQEQQYDGKTRCEVNHTTGHVSGCMVVTCGCKTDSSTILALSLTEVNGCDLDSVVYDSLSPD
jgi:hypothetical protein